MEKLERPPNPIASVASHVPPGAVSGTDILKQAPAYSCPAVTAIPSHLSISDLDLANKHILLAPITSAEVALPLHLDSCCSLSLVSKAHAEIIAQKHPQLTFTKLQSPLPVAVANPSSHLTAIGVMQVPIIWEKWSSFHLFYACCAGACLAGSFLSKSFTQDLGTHQSCCTPGLFC